ASSAPRRSTFRFFTAAITPRSTYTRGMSRAFMAALRSSASCCSVNGTARYPTEITLDCKAARRRSEALPLHGLAVGVLLLHVRRRGRRVAPHVLDRGQDVAGLH